MTDLPIIIAFSLVVTFATMFAEYEAKQQLILNECNQSNALYDQNMATLWIEAEATTTRLKECQKRKKR